MASFRDYENLGPSSNLGSSSSSSSSLQALGARIVTLSTEILSRSKACRIFVLVLSLAGAGCFLYATFLTQGSFTHVTWLVLFSAYAYYTETRRVRRRRTEVKELREKCRTLVQARRAAGLLRLQKDTRLRREHWPVPPHSGAKAFLTSMSKEVDSMAVDSPKRTRQVDYKTLCAQMAQEILHRERINSVSARVDSLKSLFRLLSQAGPEPVKDPELYRDMHLTLDEVERKAETEGFYCRLCLGYQNGSHKNSCAPVALKCKHKICRDCSHSLVESSLSGTIGVPISCPVGCNSLMSPQLLRSSLSDDIFERFQRIHTVKMSLQASAPHVRSLASELAEARKGLALSAKSRDRQQDAALDKNLTIRTKAIKEASSSSSGSRFADTSVLNHRSRIR